MVHYTLLRMAKDEKNGKGSKWTAVRLSRELKEHIETVIAGHPELGYGGLADFVRDAVRRRLEELREREFVTENGIDTALEHTRRIVLEIMGPDGLVVFDRKMAEVSAEMKNASPADVMAAIRRVLRETMGSAAERSISERIYMREVDEDVRKGEK